MENQIIVAVKGIVVHNNKVLILQRAENDDIGAGTWECVGGKIDFGETFEDALLREVKEEAGLTITMDKLLYATTFKTSVHRQIVILAYACTACDDMVMLSGEHQDYLWANQEQMIRLLSRPIIDDFNHNSVWDTIFAHAYS